MTHVVITPARYKGNAMTISHFHQQLNAVAERLAVDIPSLIGENADKLRLRKVKPDEIRVDVREHGQVSDEADLTVALYLDGETPGHVDGQVIRDRVGNMIGRWFRDNFDSESTFACSIELTVQWVQSTRINFSKDWELLDIL